MWFLKRGGGGFFMKIYIPLNFIQPFILHLLSLFYWNRKKCTFSGKVRPLWGHIKIKNTHLGRLELFCKWFQRLLKPENIHYILFSVYRKFPWYININILAVRSRTSTQQGTILWSGVNILIKNVENNILWFFCSIGENFWLVKSVRRGKHASKNIPPPLLVKLGVKSSSCRIMVNPLANFRENKKN